jgi:formate-dependent nitrite reductase membrane component NrfD
MLRVFKPSSPMNLGAWVLTAYSGAVALAVLREWMRGEGESERSLASRVVDGTLLLVCDAAGVPLALLLAGYTGVLLSGASTPVWSRNPWLGALFSASAFSTGASMIRLVLGVREEESDSLDALDKVDTLGHIAEAVTLAGFLGAAGGLGRPLLEGKPGAHFWTTVAGTVIAEVLKQLPWKLSIKPVVGLGAALMGLAGGFGLRWAMLQAGRASASDPEAARQASRPRSHVEVRFEPR